MRLKLLIVTTIILILFNSCSKEIQIGELKKEDMFTLPLGNMDNELDFFEREGVVFSLKSDIFMSKGIFLISNGNGKKIMKFNSYGDLLNKISPENSSDNQPSDIKKWDFYKPGVVTATDNYIFIEDSIEYEAALSDQYIDKSYDKTEDKSDTDKHILNEKIISIFSNNGEYINFIGQNGLGSTPFPFIKDIYSDSKNRIIVVTQTTYFWMIYRFTENGELIDKNKIELAFLPQLENENNLITQIDNIIPDKNKERLLIELTFYKEVYDTKTNNIISIESVKSRVYYYDLKEKAYISWMDIPVRKSEDDIIYSHNVLLDIVQGKYLFFISPGEDGTSQFLTITNENGYIIGDYNLNIDNSNIIYSTFYVSKDEGILTGLLCTEYAGGITMWRTDKILKKDQQ